MPQFIVRKVELGEFGDQGVIQKIVYADNREQAREEGAALLGVDQYQVEVHDMPAYDSNWNMPIVSGGDAAS